MGGEDIATTIHYRTLIVWQKGITLVKGVYQLTQRFPSDEKWGLVSQMRRAAVTIPSNIAEGQARRTTKEFIQFIAVAEGSAAELETQLIIAAELGYCSPPESIPSFQLLEELRKMLNALRRTLASRP